MPSRRHASEEPNPLVVSRGNPAMPLRMVPARPTIALLGAGASAAIVALLLGLPVATAVRITAVALLALFAAAAWDYAASLRAWRRSSVRMVRRLPPAFAIASQRPVQIAIETEGGNGWH